MNCIGYIFAQFQTIFATTVGFGLAIPVLGDVLSKNDDRLLARVEQRLEVLSHQATDRALFLKLASKKTSFEIARRRSLRFVHIASLLGMILSIGGFILLMLSTFFPEFCVTVRQAGVLSLVSSAPVVIGLWISYMWWDGARSLVNAMAISRKN